MSLKNYNIALLKTIKEPLAQVFDELLAELDEVMASNRAPKDVNANNVSTIISNLQIIGRPSLTQVAKDARYAVEQLQRASNLGWDHIRVTEVCRAIKSVVSELFDHVRTMEKGDKELAVTIWPAWAHLQSVMKKEEPAIEELFDPDPNIAADQFAALDMETLSTSAAPHTARFEAALAQMGVLLQSFAQDQWDEQLKTVESAFDWAYALKHRLGYHGYWLAARARVAYELLNSGNNTPAQNDQLLQSLKTAQVEMRKFVSDTRKPRPESLQQIMRRLLHPWPMAWDAIYQSLGEAKEVFGLKEFWSIAADLQKDKTNKLANSAMANQAELLESVHALKTAWSNLAASETPDPRSFLRGLMTFLPKYELFPNPGAKNLLDSLKVVAQRFVTGRRNDVPVDFAQEVAVCLLLIEDTIPRRGHWPAELEKQSELVKHRITLAANDATEQLYALPAVTWGAEKHRQQSQEAVSKVVKEVLTDLAYIEEVFDEYFRHDPLEARRNADAVKNKVLTSLAILNALGQHNAVVVMNEINNHVGLLNRARPADYKKEYGSLAIALSGLTSFLGAFEKGDQDAIRLLEPALAHIGAAKERDKGLEDFHSSLLPLEPSHEASLQDPAPVPSESSGRGVDSAVSEEVSALAVEEPVEEAPLEDAVEAVEQDIFAQTREEEFLASELQDEQPEGVEQNFEPQNFEQEEPSAVMPTQEELDNAQAAAQKAFDHMEDWVDSVVDEELAEAFFEEGTTVLGEISQLSEALLLNPTDREMFTDLRRQFHTLKGSGRTTQFWGLGEFARRVEVRLNEAINRSEPYSENLDALVNYGLSVVELVMGELMGGNDFVFGSDMIESLHQYIEATYVHDTRDAVDQEHDEILESESLEREQLDNGQVPDFTGEDFTSPAAQDTVGHSGVSVRQEELVRLEQVHDEENTVGVEALDDSGLDSVQVEVARLQQQDTDHVAQQSLFEDRAGDDDVAAVLHDLQAHKDNLSSVVEGEVDLSSLHWSAHTLAALGLMLEQRRFYILCKNLERKIDDAVGQSDEDVHLRPEGQELLKRVATVLIEKTSELIDAPRDPLIWDALDEEIEEELSAADLHALRSDVVDVETLGEKFSTEEGFDTLFASLESEGPEEAEQTDQPLQDKVVQDAIAPEYIEKEDSEDVVVEIATAVAVSSHDPERENKDLWPYSASEPGLDGDGAGVEEPAYEGETSAGALESEEGNGRVENTFIPQPSLGVVTEVVSLQQDLQALDRTEGNEELWERVATHMDVIMNEMAQLQEVFLRLAQSSRSGGAE